MKIGTETRKVVALALAMLTFAAPLLAQEKVAAPPAQAPAAAKPDYSQGRSHFPNIFAPYYPKPMAPVQLTNSPRVEQLIRDGKLMISLQDAISLALENNLDITVQRYVPWIADSDLLRTKAGGAARGLAGTGTASALGTIPSQNFDPTVTSNFSLDHRNIPVNNPLLSGTGVTAAGLIPLTNHNVQANFAYSQGFHTGTGFAVTQNNTRASTTSSAQQFNPSVQSTLFVSFTQQLLNGFGLLPNTRFIRMAVNSRRIADLVFQNQVITTISTVQNLYWDLVFAREDVKVKERSVQLAEKLYNDNKRQVEIGTLAPIEVVRAEAEVARTRQDLIVAQTFHLQEQMLMRNALTKNPLEAGLAAVEVVPTDAIVQPPQVELAPLPEAVNEAWQKRPDIRQSKIDLNNRDINVRATKNAQLPTLSLFGQYGWTGLAGNSRITTSQAIAGTQIVDANLNPVPGLFIPSTRTTVTGINRSGLGDAWDRIVSNDFPTYTLQLSLNIPLRNRSAQADTARAQLEQRQAEASMRRLQNSIIVEVRNAQIGLEQNRARVQAAVKSRELAERTLDAEQKKYQLGASTIFFVIQAQRDLAAAQSVEVRALADLLKAGVEYDRSLGRTLQVNKIDIADAKTGEVYRDPLIPGTPTLELVGGSQ